MRMIFIASGALACPALQAAARRPGDEVVAVVTQPERPRGRRLQPAACPVCELAGRLGLPVRQPERASAPGEIAALAALKPDLLVVAAYGQILRQALLDIAPLGAINIHPSLLPKYRGAAPIQWAIANGDTETGVAILYVTARMDAGDLILMERAPIEPDDTAGTLEPRLAAVGARLLDRALDLFATPPVPRAPQDESQVVPAPKLSKEDGRIDWTMPAEAIRNRIRGFSPWPGCFTTVPGTPPVTLKIHAAVVEAGTAEPGTVLEAGPKGIRVACGAGSLRLIRIQPEGRPAMTDAAYCCGRRDLAGLRLGG
jgi:methionyl-tRNA formyltransferase